jgi:hypothetical protein
MKSSRSRIIAATGVAALAVALFALGCTSDPALDSYKSDVSAALRELSSTTDEAVYSTMGDWADLMSEAIGQCSLFDQARLDLYDTGHAAQLLLNEDLSDLAPRLEQLQQALDRL